MLIYDIFFGLPEGVDMGTFTDQQRISTYWFNKANNLYGAAAAVYHAIQNDADFPRSQYGLGDGFSMAVACPIVYRMLCGMALEALLKAIIVESKNEPRQTHNLKQLAQDADISYSKEDQKLLLILSEAVIWDGRYPVPKKETNWDNLIELKKDYLYNKRPFVKGSTMMTYSPNDKLNWESFQNLWSIPMTKLYEIAHWILR
ncbi:MAG: HEPN domain-containing protein [Candidatus Electrothrix sp. AUS4]|nr:HEPN domain-containing protein [Candidatus Electrothrix sp. AUS4]